MPTISGIDSFQHRIIPTAINNTNGWYSAVNNGGTTPNHGGGGISFDTTTKRTADHACSLKMVVPAATVTNLRISIGSKVVVGSVYFNVPTAPASGSSKLLNMALSSGVASVGIDSSGHITSKVGSGTQQNGSTNWADGAWHRIDWYADTTGATATLDVKVDGTETLTQATLALATANMTTVMIGDNTFVSADTTVYYNDLVWSTTAGDYPLGDHICLKLEINGTGTHNKGAGTWSDEAGNTTDAELLNSVDDAWNGTTPELSQTGEDHVKKSAGVTGTEYLEFTLADTAQSGAVWGAQIGALIAALDSTTANAQSFKLVDSGGTVLKAPGAIDASVSSTAYSAYRIQDTTAPGGGWDTTALNGLKYQWGFSTDVSPNPVFNSGIVEYVCAWAGGQTVTAAALTVTPSLPTGSLTHTITGTVLTTTPSLPTGSVSGAAPQTVDAVALTVTPSLPTGSLNHSLTGTVLTVTPSLPTGSLAHTLTGTVLTATPSLPTGALAHTLTGTVLTVTPSLPAGQVTVPGAQTVTGVVLTVTPSLPTATLQHTLTGKAAWGSLIDLDASSSSVTRTNTTIRVDDGTSYGDFWGTSDSGSMVTRPITTFSTKVKVIALAGNRTNQRFYMLRKSTAADSAMFVILTNGSNSGVSIVWRDTDGAVAQYTGEGGPALPSSPFWVKLTYDGTTASGYVSSDDITYTLIDSKAVSGLTLEALVDGGGAGSDTGVTFEREEGSVFAEPQLPVGSLAVSLTGTVLTATPSLPTGSLTHALTGTVLTITPTLPIGSLTAAQVVTGVVLVVVPELPLGAVTVPAQPIWPPPFSDAIHSRRTRRYKFHHGLL